MQADMSAPETLETRPRPDLWGAVFAMSLCVFALIASEFMPVSLLTPMADTLSITEGQAGQAVSVSGLFAVLTSLSISALTAGIDRKKVVLGLTGVMMVSGLVVALAPDYLVLMVGRALIGVVIGGFWSMSAAIVMRLVSEVAMPKALAILNGGNALAATVAAPMGSFLGGLIGWRGAFFCIVPIAAIVLIWQWRSLPALPARSRSGGGNVFRLLMIPRFLAGLVAMMLLFMGQFSLFTYVRPFLETVTGAGVDTLSFTLLLIGLGGLAGTMMIGWMLKKTLYPVLVIMPLVLAAIAVALIGFGGNVVVTVILFGAWGVIATAAPVGWWTWLSWTLPRDAEAGGGLMVATIQFAITLGSALGGYLLDASGYSATFGTSAGVLVLAGLTAFVAYLSARPAGGNG